jgi:ketosteroid isomerase-like protein
MRRIIGAALLLAYVTFLALPPDRTADLRKADQDWAKAVAARNPDQFMGFVGDDAYMCGLDGKWMHGTDTIKADWKRALADPTFKLNWTIDSADISKDGNMGYTRGTFEGSQGGKPFSGGYATVWRKDKAGKWRVAVDIATPAQQP